MDIVVTIPRKEYVNDDKETEFFLNNPDAFVDGIEDVGLHPARLNVV